MTSYGQYNRNQVTSDEAADALEQSIFDSDHLYQKYRDELSPLLQEAELRLDEMGLKKFTKIENVIGKHVSRWYQLNKSLCEMSLNFRTHYNHMNVKLDSLKVEIDERDKIIRTQRKDFTNDKQQYENQLKVLESALADSIPRNKSSILNKYDQESNTESYKLIQLQKDANIQQQSYEKLKIENKRLTENLTILKSNSTDFQQTLMNLNNEISKKEDEILKLRWLTQDLAAERNGLEQKIQKHTKDENYVSVTPQRQMEYAVDFSKYIDDDQDELSDDAAENGLLSLEMSDDADINPQVAKKLAEALEAVKKVTQFANDRDNQVRQLESDKEKQQKDDDDDGDEHNDLVSSLPMSNKHPNIKPGSSHDDIIIGSRRKSILDFGNAFEQEKKRLSIHKGDNLSKLQKEDLRRSKHSRRRRSSVSNLAALGLIPPPADKIVTKSDLGGYNMKEKMTEEDKTFLKSLQKSLATVNVSKLKETPANSPLNSPTNNAPSPRGSDDDDDMMGDDDDIVDDADIHINIGAINKNNNEQLLQKQIADKQQLITDLQTNLRELSENRRRELLHFQGELENMKQRCREWYEQLMNRVGEMEQAYENKISEEIRNKHEELEHRYNNNNNNQSQSNTAEIDELSREIARLNEELEKFKGKYFDGEQQKIELADSLDEIKEEKFKMEEKLEQLANEIARYKLIIAQNDLQNAENENGNENENDLNRNHARKSTADWNDLVQKLREEKEQQEAQYEEEFREFERMANEKVVQLEEYYVQQLQMKEVHVQQLQQQLQQQLLLKQQQQQTQQPQLLLNPINNNKEEELAQLKEMKQKFTIENNKLQTELNKLQYSNKHDKEQLVQYKKKSDNNESKMQAYNASFIELAEKLKQLNDDVKLLRKENLKKQKKCDKFEKKNKKLKQQIKQLNINIDNIRIVTKELVRLKQDTKIKQEEWEREKQKLNQQINNGQQTMIEHARKKIDTINKYNVEMNNLRTNIKTLQKRLVATELECDKLKETDSQSVIGSAANWVPSVFWTKK